MDTDSETVLKRRSYNIKRSRMKRKQQYETSAMIAMIALIAMVVSLTINIAIGKSSISEEAIPPTAMQEYAYEWYPTPLEQRKMDSLYSIDAATKADMDSIKDLIDAILIKLE
jgi:hypothetical protein